MSDNDPYRDPREGQRIADERRRDEQAERATFTGAVRPQRTWILLGLAAAVSLTVLVFVALRLGRRDDRAAAPPPPPRVLVLAPSACLALSTDYHTRLDQARVCAQDDECVAQPRGEFMTGLDGCARFVVPSKDLLVADGIAERWKAGGCAGSFRTCPFPGAAICDAHACVEKPPEGLPRSWRRQDLSGVLSFFAPGDVADIGLGGILPEDSWVTRFGNAKMVLTFDVQRWDGEVPDAGIPPRVGAGNIVRTVDLKIGSAPGRLDIEGPSGVDAGGPFDVHLWAPYVPSQAGPPYPSMGGRTVSVGVNSKCSTQADCDELVQIFRTFEAW